MVLLKVLVCLKAFNGLNLVRMEVQNFEFGQEFQVLDFLDSVLGEHDHPQCRDCMEVFDITDLVIIQIQINQVRQ